MNIEIRQITNEDVDCLSQMAIETFRDAFAGTCTHEDMQNFLAENYNTGVLLVEIEDESNRYYFAEIDNIPVGYIMFKETYDSYPFLHQRRAIEIKRIYVLKAFHGKGVAQALMNFCMTTVRSQNIEVIYLGVWENNHRAISFYEKIGFTHTGYTHDFPIGNTPQTDFWYWKFLNC